MVSRTPAGVWIFSAACGLLAGLWLGRNETPAGLNHNQREMSSRRRVLASNIVEGRDFKSALARFARSGGLPEAASDAIERADGETLREWMLSLATEKIDDTNFWANRRRCGILTTLARELFQREGAEAVRWAHGTENNLLLICVLSELAREDLAAAKSLFPVYLKDRQIAANPFFDAAKDGASSRGVEELLKMEKAEGSIIGAPEFAEDFDFGKYVAETESVPGFLRAIRYWAALNPDGVEKALRAKVGPKSIDHCDGYVEAYQGRVAMVGEAEAARWIWQVLRDLPAGERMSVYPEMLSGDRESNLALWNVMPDEREKAELVFQMFRGVLDDRSLEWLNRLGSQGSRAETIERWIKARIGAMSDEGRQGLERMIDGATLSDAEKSRLRAKLPDR